MRVVIDTNRLESEELRLFLSSHLENRAVLPEHTLTEIFKPTSLNAVFASHEVLSEFAKQVIILVSNRSATSVPGHAPAVSNRFIDKRTTRSFPRYCAALNEAKAGHKNYTDQLRDRQHWARERADSIEAVLGSQKEVLEQISSQFRPADLRRFRAGAALSDHARWLILEMVTEVASSLGRGAPEPVALAKPPWRYYQFVWRYSLCHIVQLMVLISKGTTERRSDKARNDHFDNVFAAYGTYFNGLMTGDHGAMLTQALARVILKSLGTRLADDYLESLYLVNLLDVTPVSSSTWT